MSISYYGLSIYLSLLDCQHLKRSFTFPSVLFVQDLLKVALHKYAEFNWQVTWISIPVSFPYLASLVIKGRSVNI